MTYLHSRVCNSDTTYKMTTYGKHMAQIFEKLIALIAIVGLVSLTTSSYRQRWQSPKSTRERGRVLFEWWVDGFLRNLSGMPHTHVQIGILQPGCKGMVRRTVRRQILEQPRTCCGSRVSTRHQLITGRSPFRRQQVAIDDSYCHDAKMVGAHICEFKFQGRLITLIWSVG